MANKGDKVRMPSFGKGDPKTRSLPSGETGVKSVKSPALNVGQATDAFRPKPRKRGK
jgi:hypothetical protein